MMKRKKPSTEVASETNVNISVKVPAIVDIEFHYSKKKHAHGLLFFDHKNEPDENDETSKLLPHN